MLRIALLSNAPHVQAYLPTTSAEKSTFSPRYDDSDCPATPEVGFDAALYFGIGIGALSAVGALLIVRHVLARRSRYASGYRSINADD
jgi:hypothetical protein